MKKTIIVLFVSVAFVDCKKNRVCYCKSTNDQVLPDFSDKYNQTTKRKAKAACEDQNLFWSPEYTCTLK